MTKFTTNLKKKKIGEQRKSSYEIKSELGSEAKIFSTFFFLLKFFETFQIYRKLKKSL